MSSTPAYQRMSEQHLLNTVIDMCHTMKLYAYHTYDSRRSQPGFPDLVIIGRGVLWRELKDWRPSSLPTRMQLDVIHALTRAGQDAAIWRPADLFSGAITAQLTALRPSSRKDLAHDQHARSNGVVQSS